jgi:hypothetical protein
MPSRNVTPFVLRQKVAEKPVRGAAPATIHTCVNGLSFSAAILGPVRQIRADLPGVRRDMEEALNMIEQETDLPLADRMERPTGMRQTLAAIIAITRRDWLPQEHASPASDRPVDNRARCERPLSRLALNAKRSCS